MMFWRRLGWLLAPLFVAAGMVYGLMSVSAAPAATTTVLYDGAAGTLPAAQGYFNYLSNPLLNPQASQAVSAGATTLTTTAVTSEQVGYFGQNIPTLDRNAGYAVMFRARVLTETHNNPDRAGFSVIALSDDLLGIELGFWSDTIWAQEGGAEPGLFTHAEEAAFATTDWVTYTLRVMTDTYTLSAEDTAVLSGDLRDYTAFTGFPDVYETPNFLFFGDNTSSAATVVQLSKILVVQGPLVTPDEFVYLPVVLR